MFPKKIINNLNSKFQKEIKNLKNISIPRDLRNQKKDIEHIYLPKVDKNFLQERKFRNLTDSIKLKDPLVNLPELINFSLNKEFYL